MGPRTTGGLPGKFYSLQEEGSSNWDVWELLVFMLLGCAGGLIGGAFNLVNKRITVARRRFFGFTGTVGAKKPKFSKYVEVIIVSFMMSTVTFVVPLMWDTCRDIPEILPEWTEQEIAQVNLRFPFPFFFSFPPP